MKLIKQVRLYFKEGKSDKVYEVDLCELSSSDPEKYYVNFRYGRRGQKLREGTKTTEPCNIEKAQKLFDSVVIAKTNKGYSENSDLSEGASAPTKMQDQSPNEPIVISEVISELLLTKLAKESKSKRRSRFIWRLGEIGDQRNIPAIVANLGSGHWLEDYSIVWALGRIGDPSGATHVNQLLKSKNKNVRQLSSEVKILLANTDVRASILAEEMSLLPEKTRQIISSQPSLKLFSQSLIDSFQTTNKFHNETLKILYRLAIDNLKLKKALTKVLETIPFAPGYFAGIRYIYKIAELRLDHEVFGILTHRIETNKSYFHGEWDWHYDQKSGNSLEIKKELLKSDSKLAYSSKTRNYLRRRSWRSIRRLAELQDLRYLNMASGILLAVTDNDAGEKKTSNTYGWNSESGDYEVASTNHYGTYASLLSFNHIIHSNSENFQLAKSRNAWLQNGEKDIHKRQEAFSELWDKKPSLLVTLLEESRCETVHDFALSVLNDHQEFNISIESESFLKLLQSPYERTERFAFDLIKKKLNSSVFEKALIVGLASCSLLEAQDLAIEYLDSHFEDWSKDVAVITLLVLNKSEKIQQWLYKKASGFSFDTEQQRLLAGNIISACIQSDAIDSKQCQFILSFFRTYLCDSVGKLDALLIESLVLNDKRWLKQLGAGLLLLNDIAFNDISKQLKVSISSSEFEEIRAIGISLLGKQPIEELATQAILIASLFYNGEKSERDAVIQLAVLPCKQSESFAKELFNELINFAFRAENKEGQHADLQKFCMLVIASGWQLIDSNLLWRLLQAKSKAAQQIGAQVLINASADIFSVAQWAVLAGHAQKSVRSWSKSAYLKNTTAIKQSSKSALSILDSSWVDTREFAFDFFRDNFKETDWDPDLIVFVCDNSHDDVQAFGRELLQIFFKAEQGEEYLSKLSQHPSENVQLFASNFLQEYAANKPANILKLRRYFITVLSLVNRGRVCKDRIYRFLVQQAEADKKVAEFVAELFSRQSITSVIKDKSFLVKAMLKLRVLYPDLNFPLDSINKPIWQKAQGV